MTDKRHEQRINLMDFQQIEDASTGKTLGYLGDISRDGLRMLRKQKLPVGETYQLRLRYILKGGETQPLELQAQTRWERDSDSLPYCEIGFALLSPSNETLERIDIIVEDLRHRS